MEYIVFKIVCDDLDVKFNYVGSTKNFTRRKHEHKYNSKKEKYGHQKLYQIINEHGGWYRWTMVKIENITCDSTLDARTRERYWYEKLNADMNMRMTFISSEEAKKIASEWGKEYYLDYKETIASHKSEKIHCDACDCYHSRGNKSSHNKGKKHLANINKIE